jgi:hypothetical protein
MDRFIAGNGPFPESRVKVVLYFDEAHILSDLPAPRNKESKTLYDVLCSAFDHLRSSSLMVIFLSTNSHLEKLAPSGAMARSARAREHSDSLQAPITETPFDCAPALSVVPKTLTMDATCDLEFMARFRSTAVSRSVVVVVRYLRLGGRFWTMIAGAGDRKADLLSTIIDFARAKLLCQSKIDVEHHKLLKPHASTAVVDVRLMLDYEPRREASRLFEAELVAGHMRMAYSVPQSREYLRSGYPSEPLLAEAAAQQMHVFRSKDPEAVLTILMHKVKDGLIDKGERGELVARELLLSAYDRAIENEFFQSRAATVDAPSLQIPFYSKGVSLISFLQELFAPEYAEEILESLPNNVPLKTTLKEAFKHAKVRFTHFGKMADDSGTTTAAVWAALIRGMAIICRSGESCVDLILPILFWDEKLCEEVVSGILVQIKRRRVRGTVALYEIDEKCINFFPAPQLAENTSMGRPYISLVMELGVQNKVSDGAITRTKANTAVPKPITERQPQTTPSKLKVLKQGRLAHAKDCHPRYSIFAYGCSSTVYNGITQAQRAMYKFLLASGDFLGEHPRPDLESLRAVRRMKPFWSAGEPCYHWIQDEKLQSMTIENFADEGGVLTGSQMMSDREGSSEDENPFIVRQAARMAPGSKSRGGLSGLVPSTVPKEAASQESGSHHGSTSSRGKRPLADETGVHKGKKSKGRRR